MTMAAQLLGICLTLFAFGPAWSQGLGRSLKPTLAVRQSPDALLRVNVFADDNRRELKEIAAPWSAVGRLVVNSTVVCTATLIGPDLVLTNAHCILEGVPLANGTRDVNKGHIIFSAGANKTTSIAQASITKVWMGTYNEDDAVNDWAILRADWRIGDKAGWFEFSSATEGLLQLTDRALLHVVSYPNDLGQTQIPFLEQGCRFTGFRDARRLLMHSCSASGGTSGAPMFIFEKTAGGKEQPRIVGLHAKDTRPGGREPPFGVAYSDEVANIAVPAEAWRAHLASIVQGGNTDTVHGASHLSAGKRYQQTGQHDLAIAEFAEAIAIDPTEPAGYHLRGISYAAKGDLARAMTDYTKAIEGRPTYAPAYIDRGTVLMDRRNFDGAVADYSKAIEANPNYVDAYLARGRAYGRRLDFEKAIADFSRAIDLAPENAEASYERGKRYLTTGDAEKAISDFSRAITIDPNYTNALIDRGKAAETKGDLGGAVADYSRAIELVPTAFVYANRGIALDGLGNTERAVADFKKAVEIDPSYVPAIVHLANAYQKQGAVDRAASEYARAVQVNPKYIYTYVGLGRLQLAQGQLDEAIKSYSMAIELTPRSALFFSSRGKVHRIKGDIERALADYSKSVELDPGSADVVRVLGALQYAKGDFKAASASFQDALALSDSPYTMLWRYLAVARVGADGAAELGANTLRLPSKAWPFPVIDVYLGRLPSDAIVAEAAATPAARCEAQFYLGQWQILKSNVVEARSALAAALKDCPRDFVEYIGAVGEMKRLQR
jgi:tetratricopeptide (TPR) repeat protein/V8-like Glu-specific endopeptidase